MFTDPFVGSSAEARRRVDITAVERGQQLDYLRAERITPEKSVRRGSDAIGCFGLRGLRGLLSIMSRRETMNLPRRILLLLPVLAAAGLVPAFSGQRAGRDAHLGFEGIWNSATVTPLERPQQLKD